MEATPFSLQEILIAAALAVLSAAALWAMLHILSRRRREGSADGGKDKGKKKAGSFAHCELNDIMGYDFIQVRTPTPSAPTRPRKHDGGIGQGLGVTTTILSTVSSTADSEYDEPFQEERRQPSAPARSLPIQAQEETETIQEEPGGLSREQVEALNNNDWPMAEEAKSLEDRNDMMDFMLSGTPEEELAMDENDESLRPDERLSQPMPEEDALHSAEEETARLLDSLYEQQGVTPKQEDMLQRLAGINHKLNEREKQLQQDGGLPVSEDDIPDID